MSNELQSKSWWGEWLVDNEHDVCYILVMWLFLTCVRVGLMHIDASTCVYTYLTLYSWINDPSGGRIETPRSWTIEKNSIFVPLSWVGLESWVVPLVMTHTYLALPFRTLINPWGCHTVIYMTWQSLTCNQCKQVVYYSTIWSVNLAWVDYFCYGWLRRILGYELGYH